jgi:hypothetical protein
MKPFGDHLPDGSLFVVNRHDDGKFGRVHGLRLWLWQKHFLTKLTESKRSEERLPKADRRVSAASQFIESAYALSDSGVTIGGGPCSGGL